MNGGDAREHRVERGRERFGVALEQAAVTRGQIIVAAEITVESPEAPAASPPAERPEGGRDLRLGNHRERRQSAGFDIVLMDVADLDSVRAGVAGINGSVDALGEGRRNHCPGFGLRLGERGTR